MKTFKCEVRCCNSIAHYICLLHTRVSDDSSCLGWDAITGWV